ncbi:MAG: protein kinase [Thermoanaerobaculia bacterium]
MKLAPGDRVGQYEITASLGAGAMGVLYRARDPKLQREIAIKFLSTDLGANREYLARFQQEARAASSLNHPNIVTIYEISEHEGRPFIAMELIDGANLRDVAQQSGWSMRKLTGIAAQIAHGLAAAHEKGIVHRDLKPQNVMITRDGFAKILDFGLAKVAQPPVSDDEKTAELDIATHPGIVVGTAAYMSPEQARGGRTDFRSDQFSFGSILYELLSGHRPFSGESPIDTLSAVIHKDPEDLRSANPRIPEPLAWVVKRCLSKDPAERYASTLDLAQELDSIRDRLTESAGSAQWSISSHRTAFPWRIPVLTVLAVMVVAVAYLGVRRFFPADPFAQPNDRIDVTVLPFRSLNGDPASQRIGDGFAEVVGARLGSASSIRVVAPPSDTTGEADPEQVARESGAQVIVRGSLQYSGADVRATYALVDRVGRQVSAGSANGTVPQLFSLQDRIAEQVLYALDRKAPAPRPEVDPAMRQDRYLEALGYLRREENEGSVDAAIKILEALGDSPLVRSSLARAYLAKFAITQNREWASRAIEAADEAIRKDPSLADVRVTRGKVYRLENRYDDAARELLLVLQQDSSSFDAISELALVRQYQGRIQEAEKLFRRAIDLRPEYWKGYNQLAGFYTIRGEFEKALPYLHTAARLTPDNVRVLNNLGATYHQMGRYDDAEAEFQKSIAVRPNALAFANLGTLQFFAGHYDDAASSYERATALNPDDAVLWSFLGDAYRFSTRSSTRAAEAFGRSIRILRQDLTVRPRNPKTHSFLALCLAKTGHNADAVSQATLAAELAPRDGYVHYESGVACELAGRRDLAVQYLAEAARNGYPVRELTRDPDLKSLRKDQRWSRIVQSRENTKREGS